MQIGHVTYVLEKLYVYQFGFCGMCVCVCLSVCQCVCLSVCVSVYQWRWDVECVRDVYEDVSVSHRLLTQCEKRVDAYDHGASMSSDVFILIEDEYW